MSELALIQSSAVPLPVEHIDTDQIIPARFLKMVGRSGFGDNLFRDWRYHRDGSFNTDFVLNNDMYSGRILVAGHNFGCGSSREHAAWALKQYGFDVVISSEFADIFKNNALNNAIIPVEVSRDFLHRIFTAIENNPSEEFRLSLPDQTLTILSQPDKSFSFEINPFKKSCLLQGMDELDYLMSLSPEIDKFESLHKIY